VTCITMKINIKNWRIWKLFIKSNSCVLHCNQRSKLLSASVYVQNVLFATTHTCTWQTARTWSTHYWCDSQAVAHTSIYACVNAEGREIAIFCDQQSKLLTKVSLPSRHWSEKRRKLPQRGPQTQRLWLKKRIFVRLMWNTKSTFCRQWCMLVHTALHGKYWSLSSSQHQ